MFSTLPKTNFNFSVAFNLSSANAFNLDQSKILLCGKELRENRSREGVTERSDCNMQSLPFPILAFNPFPDDRILDFSKLKKFTDDNLKFDEKW